MLQWQAKRNFISQMKARGGRTRARAMATAVGKAPRKRATKRLKAHVAKASPAAPVVNSKWNELTLKHYPDAGDAAAGVDRVVPLLKAMIGLSRHLQISTTATRWAATARTECTAVAQLAWTVGIRSGPEIAAFAAGSMRLQRAMGEKMAGQVRWKQQGQQR